MSILYDDPVYPYQADRYKTLDTIFCIVFILGSIIGLLYLLLIIRVGIEIRTGKRKSGGMSGGKVASLLLSVSMILYAGFCIYYLPNILFGKISWNAVSVWASEFCIYGSCVGYLAFILVMVYVLLVFHFPKEGEINYLALIPLSLFNGLASAMIILSNNVIYQHKYKFLFVQSNLSSYESRYF